MALFQEEQALLESISGIGATTAAVINADIGVDMRVFQSDKHLVSWVGLYPGNRKTCGKPLSKATTYGNPSLRSVLTQVAWAVSHTKDHYMSTQSHHLARSLGRKKAIVALAQSILVVMIIYHVLRTKKPYADLDCFFSLYEAHFTQA